ncbi:hypothetical protein LTR36_000317 [Oleoguttula mirabilis]|uniref:Uncharacterized protein n=1 Tax=Oleoguttula mirabilis TaxID=1507867 RepID=A0AAV9JY72_9PEZI|nr:hypothetical protein LTR36_000317 [Oleoguttula mirabilis]
MPPKTAVPPHLKPKRPSKQELDAINIYLDQKPDFDKLVTEAKQDPQQPPAKQETDYNRKLDAAVKDNIMDQVAKESSDSTASTHALHQGETQTMAKMEDHQAQPGPVIAEKMEAPASKDELKKRAEELNK